MHSSEIKYIDATLVPRHTLPRVTITKYPGLDITAPHRKRRRDERELNYGSRNYSKIN